MFRPPSLIRYFLAIILMSKKAYIFSQLFRDVRMSSGLSQWIVSVKAGTHLSNVNQIEAGHQEPRVHVAVRLVAACDVDLNSFFRN